MMKKIPLKQLEEWAIAWINDDFKQARLKITFFYLLIIFILLNLFAGSLFLILQKESEKYQEKVHIYFEKQESVYINQNGIAVVSVQPQLVSFRGGDLINYHKIFVQIIESWLWKIEFVLLILAGFLSYFLAGISMRPIELKNREQKKFLADVSHELKNPLSAIKMSLEVAKKQKEWRAGEVQETFSDLEKEVNRLIKMTDELLLLEKKKERGEVEIDLKKLVLDLVEKLRPFAEQKNISFDLDLSEVKVFGNLEEWEKIIFNLLHNAIKFSKQNGKVEIELKNGFLRIRDFGVGIKKENLKKIFDRFFKEDQARVLGNESGSGLGLSIVKTLAEKNGIKIEVKSERKSKKEKMTEFVLRWN